MFVDVKKTARKITCFLFLILPALILVSCDYSAVFEKNETIQKATWPASQKVGFDVTISDSLQLYNFYINLRHNTDYEFSNLYLFVGTHYPDGNYSRDTIELILSQPDGKWIGKGFGKLKENNILIKRGLVFPRKGNYRFEFEQAMRTEELKGIEDIGIRLEKMEN